MQIAEENDSDAFGRGLNPRIPYAYAGKRFDPATGLIYFGQRDYDPNLGRWITQDPAGWADSSNLYQYVFNNPFAYRDPDGQFAFVIPFLIWGAEIALPTLSACVGPIIYGALTGAVVYGGYQMTQALNKNPISWTYIPPTPVLSDFLYQDNYSYDYIIWNNTDVDNAIEKRSSAPGPDPRAQGNPHTIIEIPGPAGQYTTHNEDGSFNQYRGFGKPHGNIPRPNVKENKINNSPKGPIPGKPTVRPAKPEEIPKG
jgi:RHS repeat-associated protein